MNGTSRIIARFRDVHSDRYDYSRVEYQGMKQAVKIICRRHGAFEQRPDTHIKGNDGCGGCRAKTTYRKFIELLMARHGDRFDYSRVEYSSEPRPITLICEHGPFEAWSVNAVRPGFVGCKWCSAAGMKARQAARIVGRFRAVHGDSYDYSDFVYRDMHIVGDIICPKHGTFPMTPANHLSAHGCTGCKCNASSSQEDRWVAALEVALGSKAERAVRVPGFAGRLDATFARVAVEFDGSYWHARPGALAKDERKTAAAVAHGLHVVRLRAHERGRAKLPAVRGASNLWVPGSPDEAALDDVAKEIRRLAALDGS